jgi:hypothetical protein
VEIHGNQLSTKPHNPQKHLHYDDKIQEMQHGLPLHPHPQGWRLLFLRSKHQTQI